MAEEAFAPVALVRSGAEAERTLPSPSFGSTRLFVPATIWRRTPPRASGSRLAATDLCTPFSLWPFENMQAAEPIALIGSDPRANFDASVSPEVLHRAAQLATEIALRWAKHRKSRPLLPRLVVTEVRSTR